MSKRFQIFHFYHKSIVTVCDDKRIDACVLQYAVSESGPATSSAVDHQVLFFFELCGSLLELGKRDEDAVLNDASRLPFWLVPHIQVLPIGDFQNLLAIENFRLRFLSRVVGNLEVVITQNIEVAYSHCPTNDPISISLANYKQYWRFRAGHHRNPMAHGADRRHPVGTMNQSSFSFHSGIENSGILSSFLKLFNGQRFVDFMELLLERPRPNVIELRIMEEIFWRSSHPVQQLVHELLLSFYSEAIVSGHLLTQGAKISCSN